MKHALGVCIIVLTLAGCRQADSPLAPPIYATPTQALIINSFNEDDTVILHQGWYRVGTYYDFSPFAYIAINFNVDRLKYLSAVSHVTVRVGPELYLTDSVNTSEKVVSFRIASASLSKPHFSALTFIAPDSDATLLLSRLQVVGLSQ